MTTHIRFLTVVAAGGLTLLGAGCATTGPAASCDAGFVSLFDGKSLDGWERLRESGEVVPPEESAFSVRDGMIHCSGKGKDYWLARKERYADCVLRLEYMLVSKGCNSGVFLRAPDAARPAFKGFEVQILDDSGRDAGKHSSGSIFDVLAPMLNTARPVGEWNEMEISCRGLLVVVRLNGVKVIDADFGELTKPIGKFDFPYAKMPREGLIGVQNHGGELWFRNIRVKRL